MPRIISFCRSNRRGDKTPLELFVRAVAESQTAEITLVKELDAAVRQIISRSVASDAVVDIFAAAGMDRPDISILSDEFLAEVRDMPHMNLALEVLRKLLGDEIKTRSRKNLLQSRSFVEMLERTIKKYQNRSIDAAPVIAELVELAKEMREARQRGEALGLTEDEEAFYEALEVNDNAVAILGDKALSFQHKCANLNADWHHGENGRFNDGPVFIAMSRP